MSASRGSPAVFSGRIVAHGQPLALSTSVNVNEALGEARRRGLATIPRIKKAEASACRILHDPVAPRGRERA